MHMLLRLKVQVSQVLAKCTPTCDSVLGDCNKKESDSQNYFNETDYASYPPLYQMVDIYQIISVFVKITKDNVCE